MARRLGRARWNRDRKAAAPEVPFESLPSTGGTPLPEPVRPPEIVVPRSPGRFETDAEIGVHSKLYDAPQKRREFLVYLPAGWKKEVQAPLLVLCHGCRQTPQEFAKGTRITELADQLGCIVLLPRQTRLANPWRCWCWFDQATASGGGETEIVAAQIRLIRRRFRTDPRRVVAVGISAGAALAAALGIHFPRQVRAVATHSGVACGAAISNLSAGDVMLRGPNTDVEAIAAQARAKAGHALPVPLLAIHGEADTVISPANSIALVRQYLRFNGHPAVAGETGAAADLPPADDTFAVATTDGRDVTTREWHIDRRLAVRYVSVAGLGHAWSGGDDALSYNDRHAPDASMLVGEFLNEILLQAPAAEH
jgi:poly(hydroxyalkanoate) depolymerase family esterase